MAEHHPLIGSSVASQQYRALTWYPGDSRKTTASACAAMAFTEGRLMDMMARMVASTMAEVQAAWSTTGGGHGNRINRRRSPRSGSCMSARRRVPTSKSHSHRQTSRRSGRWKPSRSCRMRRICPTELDPERTESLVLPQKSAELFPVLVLKTEGEAKFLLKSPGVRRLRAWRKL